MYEVEEYPDPEGIVDRAAVLARDHVLRSVSEAPVWDGTFPRPRAGTFDVDGLTAEETIARVAMLRAALERACRACRGLGRRWAAEEPERRRLRLWRSVQAGAWLEPPTEACAACGGTGEIRGR